MRISPFVSSLLFFVLLVGCTNSSSLPVSVPSENLKPAVQASPPVIPESTTFKDPNGSFEVKNDEIFVKGVKVGYVKNNIIYLQIHGKTINFPGNLQNLSFGSVDAAPFNVGGFSLYGLTYYPQYRGPYAVYKPIDPTKISYVCNGSLVLNSNGTPRPFQYCETNGKDSLSQYEYSGAGDGFSTGAGYGEIWQKVYIKRLNGVNFIFSTSLPGQVVLTNDASFGEIFEAYDVLVWYKFMDSDKVSSSLRTKSSFSSDEYAKAEKELAPLIKEIRTIISSRAYLDLLLANPDTRQKLRVWDFTISSMSDKPII